MSLHLKPAEFVEALDGALARSRERHLVQCDGCRAQLAELRRVYDNLHASDEVPEPSPLFWDHFSRRVQTAVAAAPSPSEKPWELGWRPVLAATVVVVSIAATFAIVRNRNVEPAEMVYQPSQAVWDAALGQDESWSFVADLASSVPFEDFRQIAAPHPDATDALVAQLTPGQQAELVRLLKAGDRGSE